MRKLVFTAPLAAWVVALAATLTIVPALAGDGSLSPDLQDVRAAVAKYHSFGQAQSDLHVWVAEQNPSGVFAPFNPRLAC
jgi:hypothetical protein